MWNKKTYYLSLFQTYLRILTAWTWNWYLSEISAPAHEVRRCAYNNCFAVIISWLLFHSFFLHDSKESQRFCSVIANTVACIFQAIMTCTGRKRFVLIIANRCACIETYLIRCWLHTRPSRRKPANYDFIFQMNHQNQHLIHVANAA